MKQIRDVKELMNLKSGESVYIIKNGQVNPYKFACVHPSIEGVILVNTGSYTTCVVLYGTLAGIRNSVLVGNYDSDLVGNIMVSQLEKEIEDIKDVYLKETTAS